MNLNEIIQHNVTALATALRRAGFKSTTAEYAGSGDSGDYFEIAFDGPSDVAIGKVKTLSPVDRGYFDAYDKDYQTVEQESDFDSALEDLVWQMVSISGHDGWENNDGGGGALTLYSNGIADLDHYDNVVEQQHSEYQVKGDMRFNDEGEGDDLPDA